MSRIERQFLFAFVLWFAITGTVQWASLPKEGLREFCLWGLLCGANLGSLGKLFANLAEAVSSVDPIRKRKNYLRAIVWAFVKGLSLLALLGLFLYGVPASKSSTFLGLSGWIAVPLLLGVLEIRGRRS
jgi:hypothetical protein